MSTNHVVATAEEAEALLEYFNGFHDGFIKQLTLISHDYFEAGEYRSAQGGSTSTSIAHYNYRDGSLRRIRSSTHTSHTCGTCTRTCLATPPSGRS